MLSSALQSGKRLLERIALFVTLAVLALAGLGTWLFLQDPREPAAAVEVEIRRLETLRESLQRSVTDTKHHEQVFQVEAAHHEARIARAGDVLASLRADQSRWARWFGSAEEQALISRRIERLLGLQASERLKATEARHAAAYWTEEHDEAREDLADTQGRIDLYQLLPSPVFHYFHSAWTRSRWYVLVAALVYFLGGPVRRFLLFYLLAPRMARSRALRLGEDAGAVPSVGASSPTLQVALWPGEILRVKPDHCVSADDQITRRMRWLLDGRLPLTSLLCGFVRMLELHHSHVGGESRVLLVAGEGRGGELMQVQIPEGTAMVVRPSLLAGVIVRSGERLQLSRRWRIFHWQSWATRRFGYFELSGPCRAVLNTSRPMRAERLAPREGAPKPLRRVTPELEVAFSPQLERRLARAPRFWAYCRGRSPLFETAISGDGVLVVKDAAGVGGRTRAGRFRSRLLRVFGL